MALLRTAALSQRATAQAALCSRILSWPGAEAEASASGAQQGLRGTSEAAPAVAPSRCGARGARGFAAQTPAEKYELFAPESGLTNVEGYTAGGFIVNDVTLQGGLLCLRNAFYSWDAASLDLSAIMLLNPLPEVLVFGGGASIRPLPPQLAQQLQCRGIGLEVSNTVNAIATFNILAQEGRHVAGAFVPLTEPGT